MTQISSQSIGLATSNWQPFQQMGLLGRQEIHRIHGFQQARRRLANLVVSRGGEMLLLTREGGTHCGQPLGGVKVAEPPPVPPVEEMRAPAPPSL